VNQHYLLYRYRIQSQQLKIQQNQQLTENARKSLILLRLFFRQGRIYNESFLCVKRRFMRIK
jgi:hypothetical protein